MSETMFTNEKGEQVFMRAEAPFKDDTVIHLTMQFGWRGLGEKHLWLTRREAIELHALLRDHLAIETVVIKNPHADDDRNAYDGSLQR